MQNMQDCKWRTAKKSNFALKSRRYLLKVFLILDAATTYTLNYRNRWVQLFLDSRTNQLLHDQQLYWCPSNIQHHEVTLRSWLPVFRDNVMFSQRPVFSKSCLVQLGLTPFSSIIYMGHQSIRSSSWAGSYFVRRAGRTFRSIR